MHLTFDSMIELICLKQNGKTINKFYYLVPDKSWVLVIFDEGAVIVHWNGQGIIQEWQWRENDEKLFKDWLNDPLR